MARPKKQGKTRGHGEGAVFARTRKRKDGTSYIRWQGAVDLGYDGLGGRKRKTVYGHTRKEVIAKIEGIRRQVSDGTFSTSKLTMSDYLKKWLSEKTRSVKPRTAEMYTDWTERLVKPRIGRVKLVKLKPLHVQNLVSEIADSSGVSTANKVRRMLFGALRQAVKWQLVARNVCEAVDPLKETPKPLILWTPQEAVRFLREARTHRLYASFYLLMATGLRRGEMLGLKWTDFKGDRLHVQRTYTRTSAGNVWSTPKTERGKRFVTLPSDALDVISAHRERQKAEVAKSLGVWLDEELVFTTELGGPISPVSFQYAWKRLQETAEVPIIRIHDLRHLHVSLMIRKGFDPRTVADRVGHTDPAFTLKQYTHMFEEQRQAAAVNLSELLGSNVAPEKTN